MSKEEINSWHDTALDQEDIKRFCKANRLHFDLVDLGPGMATSWAYYQFVFTGNTKNEYNRGNTNHWMFVFGPKQSPNQPVPKLLFDSYGQSSSYDLPKGVEMIKNKPSRLQEYAPASVCGQYCCVFYDWLVGNYKKDPDHKLSDVGREFCHHFGFTENRLENDKIILEAFKNGLGIKDSEPSHEPQDADEKAKQIKNAPEEPKPAKTPDDGETKAGTGESMPEEHGGDQKIEE